MKKIFSTILISLFIFGFHVACFAQEVTLEQFQKIVSAQIQEDLKNYDLDELEVIVNRLPVEKLILPEGKVTVKVTSNSKNLVPREYKKIDMDFNTFRAEIVKDIEIYLNDWIDWNMKDDSKMLKSREIELRNKLSIVKEKMILEN